MVKEIMEGIGDSGIRCGVIGEMGCSWPLTEGEKRSLQAAALAQQKTGKEGIHMAEAALVTVVFCYMFLIFFICITFLHLFTLLFICLLFCLSVYSFVYLFTLLFICLLP